MENLKEKRERMIKTKFEIKKLFNSEKAEKQINQNVSQLNFQIWEQREMWFSFANKFFGTKQFQVLLFDRINYLEAEILRLQLLLLAAPAAVADAGVGVYERECARGCVRDTLAICPPSVVEPENEIATN